MRLAYVFAVSSLLGATLVLPAGARADEPKPAAPPDAPTPTPAPGEPATPPPEPPKAAAVAPAAAWRDLAPLLGDAQKRSELTTRAKAYLAEWEATKQEPTPDDKWFLGLLLQHAQRGPEAAALFKQLTDSETRSEKQRALSATAYASIMVQAANAGTLKGEPLAVAVADVERWAHLGEPTTRASLLGVLGTLQRAAGEDEKAIAAWVGAAEASNDRAFGMASNVVDLLGEDLHTFESYERARARLAPVLTKLRALQESALATAKKLRDEEQDNAWKSRRDMAFRTAERGLEQFQDVDKSLRLLGTPAEDWTLVKAYGAGKHVADYRGKVVVLDFWTTWCQYCIRSFPALRDVVKDYAGKDVAVVGVTVSASNVFDHRYALDADLKAKGDDARTKPTLTRPRAPAASDGSEGDPAAQADYEKALEEFRAKEQGLLATFIANHEMKWDVVQIDEKEPSSKYLLRGWPHCVVLDREGRIRHFHSGALLREEPEEVAKFRAVLDDLLAEPAPAAATKKDE